MAWISGGRRCSVRGVALLNSGCGVDQWGAALHKVGYVVVSCVWHCSVGVWRCSLGVWRCTVGVWRLLSSGRGIAKWGVAFAQFEV